MNNKLLLVLLVVSLISFLIGLINVLNGNFSGLAYPFVPLEIFIWGDALIISPFLIGACIFLMKKNNYIWTGLVLSSYYLVRSYFEVIYDLDAQFSDSVRPWEKNWGSWNLVQSIGRIEVFVISQLFFTIITIISFIFLIIFFKKYIKQGSA